MADEVKNISHILWQTGEPTEEGRYLVQTKEAGFHFDNFSSCTKRWVTYFSDEVVAWCKLSDIKPYKEV